MCCDLKKAPLRERTALSKRGLVGARSVLQQVKVNKKRKKKKYMYCMRAYGMRSASADYAELNLWTSH